MPIRFRLAGNERLQLSCMSFTKLTFAEYRAAHNENLTTSLRDNEAPFRFQFETSSGELVFEENPDKKKDRDKGRYVKNTEPHYAKLMEKIKQVLESNPDLKLNDIDKDIVSSKNRYYVVFKGPKKTLHIYQYAF
jgi:hypothetical protein